MATLKSVPFRTFLKGHPEVAESVLERHGLSKEAANKLHVLVLADVPSAEQVRGADSQYRHITTVVLMVNPLDARNAIWGTAIKCPDDPFEPERGEIIAFARAAKRLAAGL